jgi:tripartite-type tricarboxylate transporter receptor subunit TctC
LKTSRARRARSASAPSRAKPDGYTLLVQSSSYTITPITYPNTPDDTLRDLVGVTPLTLLPQALVVSPALSRDKGITSMQGLIAAAKARPWRAELRLGGHGHRQPAQCRTLPACAVQGYTEVVTERLADRGDKYRAVHTTHVEICLTA